MHSQYRSALNAWLRAECLFLVLGACQYLYNSMALQCSLKPAQLCVKDVFVLQAGTTKSLQLPAGCPPVAARIFTECTHTEPDCRPSAQQVVEWLRQA